MNSKDGKSAIPLFVIGASDLAFVLLFFFMMAGGESVPMESLEMPFKAMVQDIDAVPDTMIFRIFIGELDSVADSSRLRLQYSSDTILSYSNDDLLKPNLYRQVSADLADFAQGVDLVGDSIPVAIFGHPKSFHGFVSAVVAACRKNGYYSYLVFRLDETAP
jgi:hypothetical protein